MQKGKRRASAVRHISKSIFKKALLKYLRVNLDRFWFLEGITKGSPYQVDAYVSPVSSQLYENPSRLTGHPQRSIDQHQEKGGNCEEKSYMKTLYGCFLPLD